MGSALWKAREPAEPEPKAATTGLAAPCDEKRKAEQYQQCANKRFHGQPADHLELNVGGRVFETTVSTLRAEAGNFFDRLFTGDIGDPQRKHLFVDREGEHFQHLLNAMRSNCITQNMLQQPLRQHLLLECDFYGLSSVERKLRGGYRQQALSETELEMQMARHAELLGHDQDGLNEATQLIDVYQQLESFVPATAHGLDFPILFENARQWPPANDMKYSVVPSLMQFKDHYWNIHCKLLATGQPIHDVGSFLNLHPEELVPKAFEDGDPQADLFHMPNNFGDRMVGSLFSGLDMTGLLFAGGSVLRALTCVGRPIDKTWYGSTQWRQTVHGDMDIDIFLHSLTLPEANRKVAEICELLKARLGRCVVVRTGQALTFVPTDAHEFPNIQLVLSVYPSPYHVLASCDLDCCGVGFDGTKVLCLPQAQRAINNRMNIYNPRSRSLCGGRGERRVFKYAQRGFAYGVPGLQLGRIDKSITKLTDMDQELQGLGLLFSLDKASPIDCGNRTKSSKTQSGILQKDIFHQIDEWFAYEDKHGRVLDLEDPIGKRLMSWLVTLMRDPNKDPDGEDLGVGSRWYPQFLEFGRLLKSGEIRSTIRWDLVQRLMDHTERTSELNYPGLSHPSLPLKFMQFVIAHRKGALRNVLGGQLTECFGRLRSLSLFSLPPPDIGIGTVHETAAHVLEHDSGGLPHLACGTLHAWGNGPIESWIPSRASPWFCHKDIHALLEYKLMANLSKQQPSAGQVGFDVSHYLGFPHPEGFSSEFVHDELLLSAPGTVEQLQRVLSAPLTRVARIEHSYHFDDAWQKRSAEWFSSAYDPALFDITEATENVI